METPAERIVRLGFASAGERHKWTIEHQDELLAYYDRYGTEATKRKYHVGSSTIAWLREFIQGEQDADKEVNMVNTRKDEVYKLFAEGNLPNSVKVKALVPYAGTRNLLYQAWKRGKSPKSMAKEVNIPIPRESQEEISLGKELPDEASILDNFISMIERAISNYRNLKAENQQLKASNKKWQQMAGRLNQDIQAMIHSG